MALVAGDRLGPYEILAAVGKGGMGEVYRARNTRLERTVAIKILPRVWPSDRTCAIDSSARQRRSPFPGYDVTRDGQRFLMVKEGGQAPTQITVVQTGSVSCRVAADQEAIELINAQCQRHNAQSPTSCWALSMIVH
jgi:hypothetical protein